MAAGTEHQHRRDALPAGTRVGAYEIESILGHGGFGIVYEARHVNLDSVVAVKELLPVELAVRDGSTVHPRSADCVEAFEEARKRFLEEAKSLIQFRSDPGVVTCLDFFQANGTAYLVMEHEQGMPLSELLRRREADGRPFGQADLLRLAEPLLRALSRVHKAGVLHRDIKPSNILVRRRDDRPVLIDFGAAKQTAALHSKSIAPTTEGYAAIEQVGEGKLGTWTDLYAVGAVLWRIVAGGKPPWMPPNPIKVESRMNAKVRGATEPLPTARALGSGRFSDGLLEAIDRCMELAENDRVQDCEQLLRLLKADSRRASSSVAQPGTGDSEHSRVTKDAKPVVIRNRRIQPVFVRLALPLVGVAMICGALWFAVRCRSISYPSKARSPSRETTSPSLLTTFTTESPRPATQSPSDETAATTFTRGSHLVDVLRIQGTPESVATYSDYEVWRYGSSFVHLSLRDARVMRWQNRGDLQARLEPGPNVTSATTLTWGSHRDDVLRIQGTPDSIYTYPDHEVWYFGLSNVRVSLLNGRVTQWSDEGDLQVR